MILKLQKTLTRKISIPGFRDLPPEIILLVAKRLDLCDLNSLVQTNRYLNYLLYNELLKQGTKSHTGLYGRTILHWAAANNRRNLVIDLLALGANVNTSDRDGATALHSAVILRKDDMVKLLLENGADTEAVMMRHWAPIEIAAASGNHTAVTLLLNYRSSIRSSQSDTLAKSALQYAALFGHVAVMDVLIERFRDIEDYTLVAAQMAQASGEEGAPAVQRFLELGIDIREGLQPSVPFFTRHYAKKSLKHLMLGEKWDRDYNRSRNRYPAMFTRRARKLASRVSRPVTGGN